MIASQNVASTRDDQLRNDGLTEQSNTEDTTQLNLRLHSAALAEQMQSFNTRVLANGGGATTSKSGRDPSPANQKHYTTSSVTFTARNLEVATNGEGVITVTATGVETLSGITT